MKTSNSLDTRSALQLSFIAVMALSAGVGCVGAPDDSTEAGDIVESESALSSVAQHGALHITGSQLQDQAGGAVQLKGMSLFWSQWAGQFYNPGVVSTLADDWHASVVRAAMGVESGGYLENPGTEKSHVQAIVNAAVAKGIYVIIDWHDHNATQHTAQSKQFFTEMAQLYGNTPNVIFEIYNEPVNVQWPQIKSYAQEVIGAIRGAGANNVVIVGTPNWSQDVDAAANDPITGYSNVAYTLHFYAGTHKQWLRDKASYAKSKGLALFVTEWGTCDASGNGGLDLNESQTWITFLNQNGISHANWSLFDKQETASALYPGSSTTGGWPDSSLTDSGKFAKAKILEGTNDGGAGGDFSGRITLRAAVDNQYVCADNWGADALIPNRDSAQAWEQFDVTQNGDGSISLRAVVNSRYVTAESSGKSPLIANRAVIGDWEKFYPVKNGDGSISLKAKVNGKYVCAENAGKSALIANRDAIGQWEKFWVGKVQ
ncbi:MAG: cellulase family glycosylhydrolase [Polyangiaceae bacterium]